MKKTATAILVICLIICIFSVSVAADSWSIKRQGDHQAPTIDKNFDYIDRYNAYYIDKNAKDDDKVIYLTFDAGYENGNIEKILDTLKCNDVQGAFFVLDNLIIRNTDLINRMTSEGHLVCNHTAKHPDMTKISDFDAFKAELEKLENVYREYSGQEIARYYRPPEGKFNETNLEFAKKCGYDTIFWSFAYADWDNNKQPDEAAAIQKIKDNTHNGMVLLLHPTSATNANILDELINYWKSEGYRFGSLDELTGKN